MVETKKIIKEGLYLTVGSILVFLFSYGFRMVLTHYLSVEEYGLFYSIWNFLTFFIFFIYLGLDQSVIYFLVKYKTQEKYDSVKTVLFSTLFFQLLATVIFILLVYLFSPYLESSYFRFPHSGSLLRLMSLFLFFSVLGGISSYVLYGFQKLKIYSFYAPVQSFLYLLFVLVLLNSGYGLSSPFLAYLITSVLLVALFLPFSLPAFNFFRYRMANFKSITRQLFAYGLPVMLVSISSRLIIQTDTLMLTRMTSLKEVGLYQAALPLATIFTFFSAGILTIIFPLFTELWHRQEKEKIELYLKSIYKYLFLLLLPLIVLTFVFSDYLILLMFGAEYLPAKWALIILLLSVLFNIFSSINFQCFSAFGNPKLVSKIVLFGALFNIIFNFVFIPFWGISGAALSTSLTYLLMFIFSLFYLKKYIQLNLNHKLFYFMILFTILSGITLWLVRNEIIILVLSSIGFVGVYCALILFLRVIDKKELKDIIASLFRKEV